VFFILTLSFIYAQDFFKKDLKHSFEKMAYLVFGILYIGAPSFCLPLILNVSLQPESKLPLFYNIDSQGTLCGSFLILFMVVLIWSNDIFAYLCGMLLGRKNVIGLAASPKKSWAGYIGATIFTFVFTFVYYIIFTKVFKFMNFELLFYILAAFLACIAVPLGDLVESIIKRSVNLKDSGNIILGRGGILDSVDSILFFIPLYFIYLQLYFSLK
jgi:phosphatidate cytidylyltransferase